MELGVHRGMLFRDKVKECGVWFRAGSAEVLGPLWAFLYRQRGSEFLVRSGGLGAMGGHGKSLVPGRLLPVPGC